LRSESEGKNLVISVKVHFPLDLRQNALCGHMPLDLDEKSKQMSLHFILIHALCIKWHQYTLLQRADAFYSAGILVLILRARTL
tara:strand:- start:303 stop:554 length:252 start_codon:yes stop_codon:yes gene_type:complete